MTNIVIDPFKFGAPAATITLTDDSIAANNASTYNFASQALGVGTTADHIIVAIGSLTTAGAFTVDSVTVDGQAATIVVNSSSLTDDGLDMAAAIAIAPATANATGTISVTFSATQARAAIGVYRVTNLLSATATDTGSDSGDNPSDTLNVSAGGVAVGVVTFGSADASWTGLTERYDAAIESSTRHSGAADAFAAAQSGLAISATLTANVAFGLASFR